MLLLVQTKQYVKVMRVFGRLSRTVLACFRTETERQRAFVKGALGVVEYVRGEGGKRNTIIKKKTPGKQKKKNVYGTGTDSSLSLTYTELGIFLRLQCTHRVFRKKEIYLNFPPKCCPA